MVCRRCFDCGGSLKLLAVGYGKCGCFVDFGKNWEFVFGIMVVLETILECYVSM